MKDGAIRRLVYSIDNQGGLEEVVTTIQGIMCKAELPSSNRATSKRAKYLRQRVSITGMGNTSFDDATANLILIEEDPAFSDFKGYKALDTSNRYFTARDDRSENDSIPLGMDVDPHRFLLQAAGGAYVHTGDNKVYYR